jgi:hypothetical protein
MKQLYSKGCPTGIFMGMKINIGDPVLTDVGVGIVTFIRPPFKDGSKGLITVEISNAKYLMEAPEGYEWREEE